MRRPRAAPRVRLLTGLVLVALLSGCAAVSPTPATPSPIAPPEAAPIERVFHGVANATRGHPFDANFSVEVPAGAAGLNGTLSWRPSEAHPRLTLVDPSGNLTEVGYPPAPGVLVVVTTRPPVPGNWSFRVTAEFAVNASFTLDTFLEPVVPAHNAFAQNITLAPRSIFEVNVVLDKNASMRYAFDASAPLAWDVHSHRDVSTVEWRNGTSARESGTFTSPALGVYSLLLEDRGDSPIAIDIRVEGAFRMHSHG